MLILQSSFYAIAVGFCVLFSLLLVQAEQRIPVRYFIFYLLLEACSFTFEWLMIHPATPFKGLWLTAIMGLSFFVAPCLWLFAREISDRKSPLLAPLPRWHFMLVVLGLALLLPLASSIHSGVGFPNEANPVSKEVSFFIHTTMLLAVLVFLIQTAVYLRQCFAIVKARTEQNLSLFASVEDPAINTLRLLIIAVIANWFVSALRTLYCLSFGADNGFGVVFAGFELAVMAFVIVSTLKHEVAYRSGDQLVRESLYSSGGADGGLKKYAHSGVSETQRALVLRKLASSLNQDKVYRESRLSLRMLCEHIGESTHLVSQIINESEHGRFYDMVNRHRIDEAKSLLLTSYDATILDIAFEVGYNSKSTFNSAFRKFAGMTPSQYRDRQAMTRSAPS